MKSRTGIGLLALAMATTASPAQAQSTYNFFYHFVSGDVVNGSFTGTPSGNLITGLTNISAFINGVAFNNNGNLFNLGWIYNQQLPGNPGTAVASFDGTQNALGFYDYDPTGPYDPNQGKYFSSNPYFGGPTTYASFRDGTSFVFEGEGSASTAPYDPDQWSVVEITAVPEPTSVALIAIGLFFIAFARRKLVSLRHEGDGVY